MRHRFFTLAAALSLMLLLAALSIWILGVRHVVSTGWARPEGYAAIEGTDGVFTLTFAGDLPAHAGVVRSWALRRSIFGRVPSLFRFQVIKTLKPPEGRWRFGDRRVVTASLPCWFLVAITAILPLCWLMPRWRRWIELRPGFCPACGYDLTANTSGICPECGVTLSEAKVRYGRLRSRRAAAVVLFAVPVLTLTPFAGVTAIDHYRQHLAWKNLLARQKKLLNYTASADHIVYEEDPVTARRLMALYPNYSLVGSCAGYVPPDFRDAFPDFLLGANGGPVLFVHARRTPAGIRRMVVVGLVSVGDAEDLRADIIVPASDGQPVPQPTGQSQLVIGRPTGEHFTFLAGQADPNDRSHFSIGYRLNGQPGTIDGLLLESGGVKMQVRDGPAKTLHAALKSDPHTLKFMWNPSH